jgi:hypothetical protein
MQGIATMSHGAKRSTFHILLILHIKDLSMRQGSLFCFVCHVKFTQTRAFHAMFLVFLESFQ